MPRLPTTDDYGQRPSLRTNRVDRPNAGGVELAQEWQSAVQGFNDAYTADKKKKRDLNYALARNEIQVADLEERDRLSEDPDWKTHDKRYGESLKGRVEEIRSRYDLDPSDAQILDAETRMITTKGRIGIGAAARGIEIDQGHATMMAQLDVQREKILTSKTGDRNSLMESALETIDIAEANGYFGMEGASQAEALRQATTQKFALAVIESMPAEERERLLTASLAYRRGYGVGEYAELVGAASATHGIPPELLAAQINMESSGDANAKSGAYGDPTGLMQLGRDAATDMGVTDRTDAAQSINGGAKYDAAMLEKFDGDKAKALAAYNFGPGALKKLIAEHGDNWFEELPSETKNYVKKLLPYWDGTAGPDKYLTAQDTGGGPLTREDIAGGRGTGSVADFLHTDTVAKMLESAAKENVENTDREQAQQLISDAYGEFPDDHGARMKYLRERGSGDILKKAETDMELRNNREIAEKARQGQEYFDNYAKTIEELSTTGAPLTMDEIPFEHRELMSAGQLKALKQEIEGLALDVQHAPVTQFVDPKDGGESLDQWNARPAYGPGGKVHQDLNSPIWRQALDRETWYAVQAEQNALKGMETAQVTVPNVGPLVADVLKARGYGGVTVKKQQEGIAARLELRLSAEVAARQQARTPPTALTQMEIKEIMAGYMVETAYYDDPGTDDLRRDATFNDEQLETAYLPLKDVHAASYLGTEAEFQDLTMYQFLKQKSKGLTGVPAKGAADKDIQRAYYAYKRGMGTDEVDARLRGE